MSFTYSYRGQNHRLGYTVEAFNRAEAEEKGLSLFAERQMPECEIGSTDTELWY
ncbi:hypothetical protein AB0K74_38220 [Streptomyces sp. NPDC056159]|uniref:hypothetical protein n=1 Tax=Streptomyces sp. NPDC056159 TaxID=3155537 RepID=UPI00343562D9